MRCFIALPLPKDVINGLRDIQDGLQKSGMKLRWVKAENIHLTLAFLGEITPEQAEEVGNGLIEVVKDFDPFEVIVSKLGAFSSPQNARVIWVGCREESGRLRSFQKAIVKLVKELKLPLESKKFHPHLTLGRANPPIKKLSVPDTIWNCHPGIITANEVILYESHLSSEGASYSAVKKVPIT